MPGNVDFSTAFSTAFSAAAAPGATASLLELFKEYLGIPIADTARNAQLSQYLNIAGTAAEKYIDNIIVARVVDERLAHKNYPIALRYYPVRQVQQISIDGQAQTGWKLVEQDGLFHVMPHRCSFERDHCFNNVLLQYKAGYDPIPTDLCMAIIYAATAIENTMGSGSVTTTAGGAVKKKSIVGVGSIEYDTGGQSGGVSVGGGSSGYLPEMSIEILNLYRRMWA